MSNVPANTIPPPPPPRLMTGTPMHQPGQWATDFHVRCATNPVGHWQCVEGTDDGIAEHGSFAVLVPAAPSLEWPPHSGLMCVVLVVLVCLLIGQFAQRLHPYK